MATTTLDRPTPSPSSEPIPPAATAPATTVAPVPEPVAAVSPVVRDVPATVADIHEAIAEVVLAAGLATTAFITHHVSRLVVGACELWWSGSARSAPTTA